ncbi:MAG TPA: NYN domain-containing protein [Candidatus Acidoferrales bacterium]|nr:NYN domain-containing protein [Candidatus Acidoferrales bacterium]
MPNRVCFLVDGFNVYHSVCAAQRVIKGQSLKWLDIQSLCSSYLASIGNSATLERVFYFSAFMDWIPDKVVRHQTLVDALRATGVEVQLGRFKEKEVWCKTCKQVNTHHEEKETDVAIAVKLMELLHLDACDTVVLVSGDTDLAPAVRTAKALWPARRIWALFPFARHNAELKAICHGHLKMKAKRYVAHHAQRYFGGRNCAGSRRVTVVSDATANERSRGL